MNTTLLTNKALGAVILSRAIAQQQNRDNGDREPLLLLNTLLRIVEDEIETNNMSMFFVLHHYRFQLPNLLDHIF